jgi:hypothetical protein
MNREQRGNGSVVSLIIAPDGTARCVWTDAVALHELGRLEVQRACSIEFDNEAQAWRVFDPMGDCLYCSPSRETCLTWEHKYLHWALEHA